MADPPRPPRLPPLAAVMPPLLLGTATFNTQYVDDPAAMPYRAIVRRALVDLGVGGFDTSPYYGPSETLLGEALAATGVPRARVFLETKAGRVHSRGFAYGAAAVQASVRRSLARLRTDYVDLVYAHDAEFVSPDAVVEAVRALRALRGPADGGGGLLRYVGISGFPVDVLASLAEHILRTTGEPVDAVLSYGHCTVQNARLVGPALARLRRAGVAVVLNASLLNMGLLTARGVDAGPQAAWHPSPPALRAVCAEAARVAQTAQSPPGALGGGIEQIALRYALDTWARAGAAGGVGTAASPRWPATDAAGPDPAPGVPVGASVLGVTTEAELDETVREWWSVLDGLGIPHAELAGLSSVAAPAADADKKAASLQRTRDIKAFVEETLWPVFGSWRDFAWASPEDGFVNELEDTTV